MEQLGLDRLLLVVANDPWQKSGQRAVSPAEDRFALTEALAEAIPGAEASRLEIDRGGPSYSVDTAEEVLARRRWPPGRALPGRRGGPGPRARDLAPRRGPRATWSRWPSCPGRRAKRPALPPGWRAVRVDGPQVAVSSSEVRDLLAAGEPVDGLVPPAVIRCIAPPRYVRCA